MDKDEFDTIVGEDVELSGSLRNTGSILINGKVTGDITSDQTVVVGQNAHVDGPVTGHTVQVSGQISGSINASDTLELLPESRVDGDIRASILNIQPGAIFNGTAAMGTEENAKEKEDEDQKKETIKKGKPHLELEE